MTTWASVAGQEAAQPAAVPQEPATDQPSTAVVDANAIISGLRLERIAERAVTIAEVLKEIRDQQSREYMESLPVTLECLEPSDESVRAVMAFARDSGELQSLSSVDMKLIALAHTLEVKAHGHSNLRSRPPPPRVHSKGSAQARKLPGWGEEGADWDALDQASQDTGAAAESRISSHVQALSLEDASEGGVAGGDAEGAGLSRASEDAGDGEQAEEDDSNWEVAAVSSNAARRRRRKQGRRDAHMAAAQAAGECYSGGEESSDDDDDDAGSAVTAAGVGLAEAGDVEDQHDAESGSSDEELQSEEGVEAGARGESEEGGGEGDGSSVVCVTADYAMQNVILQMGLRLAAPNGMRITRTRRWALRCTACSQVSKEAGRLFCGKCGNAALQKVEVVVGADGAEQYGVRKKHVIRGTRFSLPKPKGGKNSKDPILREDVLLQRVPQLRAKKKEDADPFAPEYSAETWYQKSAALPAHVKAAAASLDVWKRNPNERRHVRTNRRRK